MQKGQRNKLVKNLVIGGIILIICFACAYWLITSLPYFSTNRHAATTATTTVPATATTTTATMTTAVATTTTTTATATFAFRIIVESNTTWSGNYTTPEESRVIGGYTDQTLAFNASACTVCVQKQTAEGFLRVKIYVDDVLKVEEETAEPYGVITASAP